MLQKVLPHKTVKWPLRKACPALPAFRSDAKQKSAGQSSSRAWLRRNYLRSLAGEVRKTECWVR